MTDLMNQFSSFQGKPVKIGQNSAKSIKCEVAQTITIVTELRGKT